MSSLFFGTLYICCYLLLIAVCLCCIFDFFFSSRRRHTRLVSDWSSDVCSFRSIFAHRLSSVVGADRIVALEDGRVAESGRHTELMARRGAYYRLMAGQARDGLAAADFIDAVRSEERRVGKGGALRG